MRPIKKNNNNGHSEKKVQAGNYVISQPNRVLEEISSKKKQGKNKKQTNNKK